MRSYQMPFPDSLLYSRPAMIVRRFWRKLVLKLLYPPMPPEGWGQGWRVLVFRYRDGAREELHVLAPVDGKTFAWETLRPHVRGKPWPEFQHAAGKLTGVMGWAGHHTYVVAENDDRPQRLSMDSLVPGVFRGGVDRSLLLIDVRKTSLRLDDGSPAAS